MNVEEFATSAKVLSKLLAEREDYEGAESQFLQALTVLGGIRRHRNFEKGDSSAERYVHSQSVETPRHDSEGSFVTFRSVVRGSVWVTLGSPNFFGGPAHRLVIDLFCSGCAVRNAAVNLALT